MFVYAALQNQTHAAFQNAFLENHLNALREVRGEYRHHDLFEFLPFEYPSDSTA